jgi:two-component system response regulator HydG
MSGSGELANKVGVPAGSLPTRILLIDDEEDLRETLGVLLEREQLEVTAVSSGAEAIAALRERRFDLVVTDMRMPGMDGADTITALQAIDPGVRVIVATAYGPEALAVRRLRGASAVIKKPFQFQELVALVRHLLA